ncbi:HAD family hydrolase [Streptomyces alkaliterrae]|uniref:Cof-type HAD-IIB family hydrolase n=1 Tax=Streptomyces alkaliterrae TaxID=2213162 RepID=A0A5P0YR87_9ACTN|nr:Cof-type HAD-IIB family hydrolase [Streptomyces alkaliterrae]MBB1253406.1 Cof-type HAD-IIB family hydrolase [Streptomyces alkaliterrae]MBB1260009.1 Cof-type HAD-IIB family hydrolase [Streptomyces alkaliterrae]MQS02127.1 Cof-type HAD-IIB family hydrolase [Streptomyces alkaliterrae]
MSFPYRLVATDLDGTLLRGDGTVSSRTRDAIRAATDTGALHLVVTGRNVPWTIPILDELGYTGLAVCGQGGQLYHAGERRLLTSVTLDRRLAAAALTEIGRMTGPLALAASRDGLAGEVVTTRDFLVIDGGLPVLRTDDPAEILAEPVAKVYLQHPELDDDALAKAAREAAGHLVDVVMAGEGVVELLPAGLTKATGLSLAARRLGVTARETIAFGDMPNDVPMFRWAAWGVAMADAHPELREVADEVTASNDEDGIAVVLDRLRSGATTAVLD